MPLDLKTLTPNARALYWYLAATGPAQEIRHIADDSGIPISSIYKTAAAYPEVFNLTATLLRLAPQTNPNPAPTTQD